jgi:hypothetical protein
VTFQEQNGAIFLNSGDGRVFAILPAPQPDNRLIIEDAIQDTDGDGIPDWWEIKHFAGPTNALAGAFAANGINTLLETYVAGLDPSDPTARFVVRCQPQNGQMVLSWYPVLPERTYSVLMSTNPAQGYQLQANLPGPINTYTNTASPAGNAGFYRIRVQRAP